jgi:hypothetical protein
VRSLWNLKTKWFFVLGFSFEFCYAHVTFSPLLHFLDATLAKACKKCYQFFFCFYSRINMANVEDALEFDVEEGFFFFLKKKNV